MIRQLLLSVVLLGIVAPVRAADPVENDYYKLTVLPTPEGTVLEIGAIEPLPNGQVAVSTRRGEIWLVDNAYAENPAEVKWTRFAHGLHEVLGLAWRDGWLYATQRGDVSRLKDSNGDGRADLFEIVNDEWDINGDYHEYAFGSKFDRDGNIWVTLCLTGSFTSENKYRGWACGSRRTASAFQLAAASARRAAWG